jgi:phosphohistidine phosphatase
MKERSMRLHLFRHGPAGSRDAARWPDDAARPLTERGIERTARAAAGFARLERGERIAVWSSPLERSLQTARILIAALDRDVAFDECEALAPEGSFEELIERIHAARRTSETLILVGHEPALGRFAGLLAFGSSEDALALKKAGACLLTFDGTLRPGAATLKWLLPPRMLRRLAGKGARV